MSKVLAFHVSDQNLKTTVLPAQQFAPPHINPSLGMEEDHNKTEIVSFPVVIVFSPVTGVS